jgi:integrase
MTFAEAAERWLPKAPKLKNPKSQLIRERALEHLAPIHAKTLTSLAPADVVEILHTLNPETALRVYGVGKGVFAFGAVLLEAQNIILRSPFDLARLRALGWSPRSRKSHKPMPALHWSRAPELLAALERNPEPIARLVQFILATVSRCGAARIAKRKHIDLKAKTWTIPAEDLKDSAHRREAFVIPLNDVSLTAITPGSGEYVFVDDRGHPFAEKDISHLTSKLRRRIPTGSTQRPADHSPRTVAGACSAAGPRRAMNRATLSRSAWVISPTVQLSQPINAMTSSRHATS